MAEEKVLFQEAVELIGKRVGAAYKQDQNVVIQPNANTFEIKGWLREATWWYFQVDRDRLRDEGPEAIAQEFFEGYVLARGVPGALSN